MKTVVAIVAVALTVVCWCSDAKAQFLPNERQAVIIAGFGVSMVGAGVVTIVNSVGLAERDPGKVPGALGVLFGASLILFTAAVEVADDMRLDRAPAWYALGGASIVLGAISWQQAGALEPELSLRLGEDVGGSVGVRVRF